MGGRRISGVPLPDGGTRSEHRRGSRRQVFELETGEFALS